MISSLLTVGLVDGHRAPINPIVAVVFFLALAAVLVALWRSCRTPLPPGPEPDEGFGYTDMTEYETLLVGGIGETIGETRRGGGE